MTPEDWANRLRLCMRRLGPNEAIPHSVTDFPKQHAANVAVFGAIMAEERERAAKIVEAAEPWIGKEWSLQVSKEIRDGLLPRPTYALNLPLTDEWGTPVSKMPNCPHCGEDELGMMSADRAFCYRCCCTVVRKAPRIQDTPAVCGQCPWMGRVEACEPDDSGELCCPQCYAVIVVGVV